MQFKGNTRLNSTYLSSYLTIAVVFVENRLVGDDCAEEISIDWSEVCKLGRFTPDIVFDNSHYSIILKLMNITTNINGINL